MALTSYNTAATAAFSFTTNSVAGLLVQSLTLSAAPVSTETGYEPTNGAAILFGVHDGEVTTGSISGIALANGLANATIGANVGATLTPAMCALAGYTGNNGSVVCTGLSTTAQPGGFKKFSLDFTHLRAIA